MSDRYKRVLFAALLTACLSRKVRAEHAVGLEAKGVDPLTAIHNPLGLDVRDALGRPVSADVIRQELGFAARGRATIAAFASKLPKARLFAALAEFFAAPITALSSPLSIPTLKSIFASGPAGRPEPKLLVLLLSLLPVLAASAWSTSRLTPIPQSRSHRKVPVLRI